MVFLFVKEDRACSYFDRKEIARPIIIWVVLNYETKSKRNERNKTKRNEILRNATKYTKRRNETQRNETKRNLL
jgi:hypothetical protein